MLLNRHIIKLMLREQDETPVFHGNEHERNRSSNKIYFGYRQLLNQISFQVT